MKILSVLANNHRKCFEIKTRKGSFTFPFAKCTPRPTLENTVSRVYVDPELGNEALTYELKFGQEGSAHIERVLEFNQDPSMMRDLIVYQLTIEARKGLAEWGLSKREAIRRLNTSPAQLYRLLDPKRTNKSVDQLLRLLSVLGQQVQFKVLARSA